MDARGKHFGIGNVYDLEADAEKAEKALDKALGNRRQNTDNIVVVAGPVDATGCHFGIGDIHNG